MRVVIHFAGVWAGMCVLIYAADHSHGMLRGIIFGTVVGVLSAFDRAVRP